MNSIEWKSILIPDLSTPATSLNGEAFGQIVENVRTLPQKTGEFKIPDPKALRSMSRASVLLSHLCAQAADILSPFLQKSAFSVGIYCAVENGPIDAASTDQIIKAEGTNTFAELYRKNRNPKMYLKQLPNLAPAQMGISMGILGPMNVYTHSTHASYQALEQAEWDLKTGLVERALVCTAFAFDDFAVIKRERDKDMRTINEGAAALVLKKNDQITNWNSFQSTDKNNYFGLSDLMMNVIIKGEKHG